MVAAGPISSVAEAVREAPVTWAVVVVLFTLTARFLAKLYKHRKFHRDLPGPPHSWIWGSLRSIGEVSLKQPPDAAPQTMPLLVKEHYGLGDAFYLDPYPFAGPILAIFDPSMMNELAVTNSQPKHPAVAEFMVYLGGEGNLVSSEAAAWKKWRSAFNPGFSAAHLMTLVPTIVDECNIFCDIMTKHAENNDLFRMEQATTRLTVDIIGKVALDDAFGSQTGYNELVDAFNSTVRWLPVGARTQPSELIDFRRPIILRYNNWRMKRYLSKRLEERFATRESRGKSKAIVDLALTSYEKEVKAAGGDSAKVKGMDPTFKTAAISNVKTFIFAGHDTTSSTICYALYYLSRSPEKLAKVRKEHDDVFGSDYKQTGDMLKTQGHLLSKLEYTMAIIKEVLRLQPPASTVRTGADGFIMREPETGQLLPTKDVLLWPVDVGLHRHSKHWAPDPHAFRPERFLDPSDPCNKEAWVPFSKGNRNCIGQELAIIETKVILAMVLRAFDFQEAYAELGKLKGDRSGYPSRTTGPQEQYGEVAYQIQLGTAKPREGMPCRISLRK